MIFEILLKSFSYLVVTNNYIVPYAPYLFGQFPGSTNYAFVKNMFFFGLTFLITFLIYYSYNSTAITKEDLDKEKLDLKTVTLNDTLTMMLFVFIAFFIISMFPVVQILKIKFGAYMNSWLIFYNFALWGSLYMYLTSKNLKFKTVNNIKIIVLALLLFVLFIIYTINDSAISGTIPGFDFIPYQIKQILNVALKIQNLQQGKTEFLKELKENLKDTLNDTQFTKFEALLKAVLTIIPKKGIGATIFEKFSKQSNVLDKLLGPVDLTQLDKFKEILKNPIIQLILNFDQNTIVQQAQEQAIRVALSNTDSFSSMLPMDTITDTMSGLSNVESTLTGNIPKSVIDASTASLLKSAANVSSASLPKSIVDASTANFPKSLVDKTGNIPKSLVDASTSSLLKSAANIGISKQLPKRP